MLLVDQLKLQWSFSRGGRGRRKKKKHPVELENFYYPIMCRGVGYQVVYFQSSIIRKVVIEIHSREEAFLEEIDGSEIWEMCKEMFIIAYSTLIWV